jgi:hypothetical protein
VSIARIDTTIMDNGNVEEDAKLDDVVAILTFEDGTTILDINEIYNTADRSVELAATEASTYGWSIGGGLLRLCLVIAAVILRTVCYKINKCCLPVIKPFLEVKNKSKPEVVGEILRTQMEEHINRATTHGQWSTPPLNDTKLEMESLEMATFANSAVLYPALDETVPKGMVNTGGGVTPVSASAPVVTVVGEDTLGRQPGVGTSKI